MIIIEWRGATINLDKLVSVRKTTDERIATGCGISLDIHLTSDDLTIYYGSLDDKNPKYPNPVKQLQKDYEEIVDIIKKSSNLDLDRDGRFVCSYCGAPNVN